MVEDYFTTKILREEARMKGIPFEEMVKSIKIIRHINRTPENWKDAVTQMANWKKHSLAVDAIFPNDPYNQEPLQVYAWLVIKRRFEDALNQGPKHLLRLIQDFRELPQTLSFLFDNNTPDIFTQEPVTWTPQ